MLRARCRFRTPPRHPPLAILRQDDDLVAVYKPAGWLVHRTGLDAGETRFVMQALRDQLGRRVYPVHRLDKGTCGVLVMGLHAEAARALSQAFEQHRVDKRYLALVRGHAPDRVQVDHALRPDDAPPDAAVQPARTALRCLARLELPEASDARFATTRASLVEALPETGRRHQIRRHLKHIAHPILGDATHGKGPAEPLVGAAAGSAAALAARLAAGAAASGDGRDGGGGQRPAGRAAARHDGCAGRGGPGGDAGGRARPARLAGARPQPRLGPRGDAAAPGR